MQREGWPQTQGQVDAQGTDELNALLGQPRAAQMTGQGSREDEKKTRGKLGKKSPVLPTARLLYFFWLALEPGRRRVATASSLPETRWAVASLVQREEPWGG